MGPKEYGTEDSAALVADGSDVNVRCQGLRESRWWDTVNEKREDEPTLADDLVVVGSNRREEQSLG